jgi:hypothetical protein
VLQNVRDMGGQIQHGSTSTRLSGRAGDMGEPDPVPYGTGFPAWDSGADPVPYGTGFPACTSAGEGLNGLIGRWDAIDMDMLVPTRPLQAGNIRLSRQSVLLTAHAEVRIMST